VVGINDDVQSSGLFELERAGPVSIRWSGPAPAVFRLLADHQGQQRLVVQGWAPPERVQPQLHLLAAVCGQTFDWVVPSDGEPFRFEAPLDVGEGDVEAVIRTDRTWRPCDVGVGADGRELGVRLGRVAVESG
jgi:hypothetical protein